MDNDRTRPFLEEPVYNGVPASWAAKFLQSKLRKYRECNPLFDEYLNNTYEEIKGRGLAYCDNILLFLEGNAKPNWITPSKSLLRTFIKLFNYDLSSKQTVDYIEKCHDAYEFLLNNELKVSNEYSVFAKSCSWDNNTRDFIKLSLEPVKTSKNYDDSYWINIAFCSLQDSLGDPDFFGDTEIELKCGKAIYQDTLSLFDYYQGSKFLNKCLQFAISELIERCVIDKPVKVAYGFTTALFYGINKPHTFELKEREDN